MEGREAGREYGKKKEKERDDARLAISYDFLGMQSLRCQWCSINNSTESRDLVGRSGGISLPHDLPINWKWIVKA